MSGLSSFFSRKYLLFFLQQLGILLSFHFVGTTQYYNDLVYEICYIMLISASPADFPVSSTNFNEPVAFRLCILEIIHSTCRRLSIDDCLCICQTTFITCKFLCSKDSHDYFSKLFLFVITSNTPAPFLMLC